MSDDTSTGARSARGDRGEVLAAGRAGPAAGGAGAPRGARHPAASHRGARPENKGTDLFSLIDLVRAQSRFGDPGHR